jgi:hypothetical protein
MSTESRLARQLAELIATMEKIGVPIALIGGLALAPHGVIRATQDIDLLIDSAGADEAEAELLRLGYRCLHRSADAGNYLRTDERVDFLYAHRPVARRLLGEAKILPTAFGKLPVVSIEGLIAFKLQALVNNPRRTQDLEDIKALLRTNGSVLNIAELRNYFRQFNRESLLDELLNAVN